MDVFNRESVRQGIPLWESTEADVAAPAKHRLYRAIAGEHTMLGRATQRIPLSSGLGVRRVVRLFVDEVG